MSTTPFSAPVRINRIPLAVSGVLILAGALYLAQTVSSKQSALWIVGTLMGIVLYFASFGFTQAWRVFISDGRGAGLRAQMVMLAAGVILFFPFWLKAHSSATLRTALSHRRVSRSC